MESKQYVAVSMPSLLVEPRLSLVSLPTRAFTCIHSYARVSFAPSSLLPFTCTRSVAVSASGEISRVSESYPTASLLPHPSRRVSRLLCILYASV